MSYSINTKSFAVLAVVFAILLGCLFAMMLSGFGPFAASLSVGSIGGALVAAVVISWLGGVLLQARWLAATLFSVPMAFGIIFAAASHEWWRCIVLAVCILVPFVMVTQLKFDHRRHHHHHGA